MIGLVRFYFLCHGGGLKYKNLCNWGGHEVRYFLKVGILL